MTGPGRVLRRGGPRLLRRSRLVVGVTGAILVAVLGVVAFSGGGQSGGKGSTDPTAFDLPALDGGGRVRLAAFRGAPVVVNLFASWCVNCREELPAFARVAASLRGRVQFVAVDSQETGDGRAMARRYRLAEAGFALAHDLGAAPAAGLHDALGAQGLPVTAFYGPDGRLLRTFRAQVPEAALRASIHDLYGI